MPEFERPLIGTRKQNYKFFYCTGGSVIFSLFLLILITSYTAYVSTHVGDITIDMTEVLGDVKKILPDIENLFVLVERMCKSENFTKSYGDICT